MPKQNNVVTEKYLDQELDQVTQSFDTKLSELNQSFDTKLSELKQSLEGRLDWLIGKYKGHEEEHTLISGRIAEDTERIEVLEQKVGIAN